MTATPQRVCIHTLLRAAWPKHTAKHAARAAQAPVATAKGWVLGRFIPSAETLLRMAERDEALANALMRDMDARRAARAAAAAAGETVPAAGAHRAALKA